MLRATLTETLFVFRPLSIMIPGPLDDIKPLGLIIVYFYVYSHSILLGHANN